MIGNSLFCLPTYADYEQKPMMSVYEQNYYLDVHNNSSKPLDCAVRLKTVTRALFALAILTRLAGAQVPQASHKPIIGDINFYGLRKLTPEKVLAALALKLGEALPPSKG